MIVAVLSILALSATTPNFGAAQRADTAQRREKVDKAASAGRGRDAQRAEQQRAERRDKVQKAASAGRRTTDQHGVVQLKNEDAKNKSKTNARKDNVRRMIEASKSKKK